MLAADEQDRRTTTRLILVMCGLRSLAYGLLSVLLGVALAGEGFSPVVGEGRVHDNKRKSQTHYWALRQHSASPRGVLPILVVGCGV